MIVGYVQFAPILGDVRANLDTMHALTRGVHADLLVFPELATTGYALGDRRRALELGHTLDGAEVDSLRKLAGTVGGTISVGLAERSGNKVFNSALLINRSGVLQVYRKAHLFLDERDLFDRGNTGFHVRSTAKGRVGSMVCFDWAFPEAAGTLARRGAQIVAHPSNLVLPYAAHAMPVRALENRVYTITANRIGFEDTRSGRLTFNGGSRIVSPTGEILAQGPEADDDLQLVKIDPSRADDKQITARNHLHTDRRDELYE